MLKENLVRDQSLVVSIHVVLVKETFNAIIYHKKGHMNKDCPRWKAKKGKDKEESESSKGSNVKIKEINATCVDEDGDILFTWTHHF